LQTAATVGHVWDKYFATKGEEGSTFGGAAFGVARAAIGATEQVPFVNTPAMMMKSAESVGGIEAYVSNFISAILCPPDVAKIAKSLDKPQLTWDTFWNQDPVKRKAETLWQGIELNFPVARQKVPADEPQLKKNLQDAIQKDPPKANPETGETAFDSFKKKPYYKDVLDAIDKGVIAKSELDNFVQNAAMPPELKHFKALKPMLQLSILDKLDPAKDSVRIHFLVNFLHTQDAMLEKLSKHDSSMYQRYRKYLQMRIAPQDTTEE
jgi:hypothetical protein